MARLSSQIVTSNQMEYSTDGVKPNSKFKFYTYQELADLEEAQGVCPKDIDTDDHGEDDCALDDKFGAEPTWPIGQEFWHLHFGHGRIVDFNADTQAVAVLWTNDPPGTKAFWLYTLEIIKPMMGREGRCVYEQYHADHPKQEKPRAEKEQRGPEWQYAKPQQNLRSFAARPASDIPPRPWIHAKRFIRKLVTMTVAPGGYGKTALEMLNALEMALGVGLIGPPPVKGAVNVLYWNAEDPPDEVDRRIAAICQHYNIDQHKLEGRLFLGSKIVGGRFATFNQKTHTLEVNHALLEETKQFILANNIGCVMLDPLIAFHSIPESQNGPMEELIKTYFERMADETNCNVELSHHTRKPSNGANGGLTADDSRGASSVVFAARSARVLNVMTSAEAEMPNIPPEERKLYLRVTRDKANLCPPGKATWIHLINVRLPNGDDVQVVTGWDYPQPFDDVTTADMHWARAAARSWIYRSDPRSESWFGRALAERMGLDPNKPGGRKRIATIIKTWISNGVLAVEKRKDENRHASLSFPVHGKRVRQSMKITDARLTQR